MPAVFLDRLPLPSLQAYTAVSVALLSCSIYYALQVTSSTEWRHNATLAATEAALKTYSAEQQSSGNLTSSTNISTDTLILDYPLVVRFFEVINYMIQEPLCIWTMINMAYCCLILIGKFIQKLVFGELRVSEQQHIKDKFWNFVFYKFIFIFGVMNVQFMDEVVLWCSWFSVLGFLHLLAQLSKDRFEYLSFSPTTPKWTHVRLLMLLTGIMFISTSLFGICIIVGLHAGLNTFAFMAAECSLVTFRTLYVIARYAIHLWDTHHIGVWERRATYIYYTELFFELIALATDFLHHLHMLLWGNIFLSMASLVICMQLRYLFYEIQRRAKKHKNYLRVIRHMETNYKMATPEELETNSDDCAICWDAMESARKLPCGHLFHNSCLRSWLEQDTSCPTCRMTLTNGSRGINATTRNPVEGGGDHQANPDRIMPTGFLAALGATGGGQDAGRLPPHPANQTTNHFFHFDGSRYVSWFPSFSVEVTHTNLLGERAVPVQTSQLDTMARQVLQMFPHMPMNTIIEDLRVTRSVEVTVENILEERLVPPASVMFHGASPQSPPQSPAAVLTETQRQLSVSSEDRQQQNQGITDVLGLDNAAGGGCEVQPKEKSPEIVRSKLVLESFRLEEPKQDASASSTPQSCSSSRSLTTTSPSIPIPTPLGCRFSKCPQEREQMLAGRKDELLRAARRKYLLKDESDHVE